MLYLLEGTITTTVTTTQKLMVDIPTHNNIRVVSLGSISAHTF